ncbi:hypothetical protein CR513_18517, partial [Mucuna pruriens]
MATSVRVSTDLVDPPQIDRIGTNSMLEHTKKNLKVMLNITYGMIRIFGDFAMTKSFAGALRIPRSSQSSISIIQHPEVAIMDRVGQPKKYLTMGSISPPFSETLMNLS